MFVSCHIPGPAHQFSVCAPLSISSKCLVGFICATKIAASFMSQREVAVAVIMRPFAVSFQEPTMFALNVYFSFIYTSTPPINTVRFLPFHLSRYLPLARPAPWPVLRWPLRRRIHRHSPPSLRTCITSKSPSVTKRVSSSQRCACPSSSSALFSSSYVHFGSDGHPTRACTGLCQSWAQISSASTRPSFS